MSIIALLRANAIYNKFITVPMWWLAANSHTLVEYIWSIRSMGRTIDHLYSQALVLKENLMNIINKEFIIGIMKPFKEELSPF